MMSEFLTSWRWIDVLPFQVRKAGGLALGLQALRPESNLGDDAWDAALADRNTYYGSLPIYPYANLKMILEKRMP